MEKIKALIAINKSLKEILECEGCKPEETPQAVQSLDAEISKMLLSESQDVLNDIIMADNTTMDKEVYHDIKDLRDVIHNYIR